MSRPGRKRKRRCNWHSLQHHQRRQSAGTLQVLARINRSILFRLKQLRNLGLAPSSIFKQTGFIHPTRICHQRLKFLAGEMLQQEAQHVAM